MHKQSFSIQEMRQTDIVEYLKKSGHYPQKVRNNDYWYLSPLREEKEPSFKVNRKLNVWYDHGLGKGGNLIDFAMLYHNCSFKELPEKMKDVFSFHPQTPTVQQPLPTSQNLKEALEPAIKVIAAKPLTNPALCRYLNDRKITPEIARKYCKEVDFKMYGKQYFAIGFENKSGGFELRNQHFKGSSSPKDVTIVEVNNAKDLSVFEGFTSFLSYQTLHQKDATLTNFLVLNSLSFFQKSRQLIEEHRQVNLYLDRDNAGIKNTQSALKWNVKYVDQSRLYKNHKDLNDYLISLRPEMKQSRKIGRHF